MPSLSHRPMHSRPQRQSGSSLVELMVGVAIALILLTGILTVMLRVSTEGGESVKATRLNQQLRGSLDLMIKELQRSGYVNWFALWDANSDDALTLANDDINGDGALDILDFYQSVAPAINSIGAISLWGFPTRGTASGTPVISTAVGGCGASSNCDCVLYSYDLNQDGAQGVGSGGTASANQNTANFELFGFRWNEGAIQMRTGGDVHSCNSGTWQDISDDNVTITSLAFGLVYAAAAGTGNDSTSYQFTGAGAGGAMQSTCTPVDTDNATAIPVAGDTLCLWRRSVLIDVVGTLSSDEDVNVALTNRVKLKNDFFNSTP